MHPSQALCIFLIIAHLIDTINCQALTVPTNIEAQMKVLYTNSTASMASQTFPLTFTISNFSTFPSFGFGINDLFLNQNMGRVNLQTQAANLTSKAVNIMVSINNDTRIRILSISYISVWEHGGIFLISRTYTNITNISTSAGSRFFQISEGFSVGSTQIAALHFIRGFFATCTVASQLLVSVSVASTSSYLVRVNTTSDCLIRALHLTFLFYFTDSSTNSAYLYGGDTSTYSETSVNVVTYTRNLANYSNTVFIMGLGGFFCFNFASSYTLGWSIISFWSNTATIQLHRFNWQSVYYTYFQIGQKVQNTVTPTPATPSVVPQTPTNSTAQNTANAASPQKSNYLGIIVGLVVGVVSVSVAVVVIVKCYFKATAYTLPEKTDFRMLPALTF